MAEALLPVMPESMTLSRYYQTRAVLADQGEQFDAQSIADVLEVSLEDVEAVIEIAGQYEECYGAVKV
jgi:hypothetical protein